MIPKSLSLIAGTLSVAEFKVPDTVRGAVETAKSSYEAATSALGVHVLESGVMHKLFCKEHKVSPDAIMQLGFQVCTLDLMKSLQNDILCVYYYGGVIVFLYFINCHLTFVAGVPYAVRWRRCYVRVLQHVRLQARPHRDFATRHSADQGLQ